MTKSIIKIINKIEIAIDKFLQLIFYCDFIRNYAHDLTVHYGKRDLDLIYIYIT